MIGFVWWRRKNLCFLLEEEEPLTRERSSPQARCPPLILPNITYTSAVVSYGMRCRCVCSGCNEQACAPRA